MPNDRDWSDLKSKGAWVKTSLGNELASGFVEDIQELESWGVPAPKHVKLKLGKVQVKPGAEQTINGSRELRIEVTDPKTNKVLEIFRDCSVMKSIRPNPTNGLVDGPVEFESRTPPER